MPGGRDQQSHPTPPHRDQFHAIIRTAWSGQKGRADRKNPTTATHAAVRPKILRKKPAAQTLRNEFPLLGDRANAAHVSGNAYLSA